MYLTFIITLSAKKAENMKKKKKKKFGFLLCIFSNKYLSMLLDWQRFIHFYFETNQNKPTSHRHRWLCWEHVLPYWSSRWSRGTTYWLHTFNMTFRASAPLHTMLPKLLSLIMNSSFFPADCAAVCVLTQPIKRRLSERGQNNLKTSGLETAEPGDTMCVWLILCVTTSPLPLHRASKTQ